MGPVGGEQPLLAWYPCCPCAEARDRDRKLAAIAYPIRWGRLDVGLLLVNKRGVVVAQRLRDRLGDHVNVESPAIQDALQVLRIGVRDSRHDGDSQLRPRRARGTPAHARGERRRVRRGRRRCGRDAARTAGLTAGGAVDRTATAGRKHQTAYEQHRTLANASTEP